MRSGIFCQINFRQRSSSEKSKTVVPFKSRQRSDERVSAETEYVRLTVIAKYLRWLAEQITGATADKAATLQIARMGAGPKVTQTGQEEPEY